MNVSQPNLLRPLWRAKINFGIGLGLTLILIFGIPRFILVLQANQSGNYNLISFVFVVMLLAPFVLLTKNGRNRIGMVRPVSFTWLMHSFFIGLSFSIFVFIIGKLLYHDSIRNWFVYISRSYPLPVEVIDQQKITYFIIFAVIGMTFSPVGEELLYRGLIHQSFSTRFGHPTASHIDSLAFALTHLAHFGIIWSGERWEVLIIPSIFWVALTYSASRLFFLCKVRTGSIAGAIVCHAAFNLGMTWCIFFYIL
jgi:uncharacterized protein